MIELRTLRGRTLRFSLTGSSIFFLVVGAVPFLTPLLFEEVFRWSAVKSGVVVLFIFLGNVGIKPATTSLYSRFGFRTMLLASTTLMAATLVVLGFTTAATPTGLIAVVLLVSGVARSVGATGYTTIAFSEVPESQMRDANTLQATVQQLSMGFGVAIGAVALRAGNPLGHLLLGEQTPRTAYSVALVLLAIVTLAATFGAARLHPTAGDALRRAGDRQGGSVPSGNQLGDAPETAGSASTG
jgi:MFS family permease